MVKVVRPLFSDSAKGRIANIGSYRMSRNGPQFISQGKPADRQSARQLQVRACFREAHAVWRAIPPTVYYVGNRRKKKIIPDWPTFLRNWQATHPECSA